MLTRKRFVLPTFKDSHGDAALLGKAIHDYLLSLESKNSLTFSQAQIYVDQGLQFPATQVASSDVNNLDDYEEGTWTPVDSSGAALVFASGVGQYTKIGNIVFASAGNIVYPATADASNSQIGGLPFTSANTESGRGTAEIGFTTEATLAHMLVVKNATDVRLTNTTGARLTNATLSGDT